MKRITFAVALAIGTTTGVEAWAQGLAPTKVTVTGSEVLTPVTKYSATTPVVGKTPIVPGRTYRTASGGTITGAQYIDLANKLEAVAQKGGCSLGSGKTCNFRLADAKLTTAQLNQAEHVAAHALTVTPSLGTTATTTAEVKAKAPLGFSWDKEWGSHSTAAVYVGADFGNSGGSKSAGCGGAAYAGVYLFGTKKEVVRLEGSGSSSGTSVSASAALYVLGDSVWSKNASFDTSKLSWEKSFSVQKSFTYWGLVTINLTAKATGNAYISGSIGGVAKSNEFTCNVNVTPGVKATATGSAEVALLGYGSLSAAAVGVEGSLTLADLSLPITASVSAKYDTAQKKTVFTESLNADLAMNYLSGSLSAYFKTSIPLDGEKIWDWDSDKFSFTILDWDGYSYNQPLFHKTATQNL